MDRVGVLVCLSLMVAMTTQTPLDPRGARPVEQGTRSDKCDPAQKWGFCTDDQWGPKCPSGCRIMGLMDQQDRLLVQKVEKIRSLLSQYQTKHRSADTSSKTTYDYLKEKLITDAGFDNNYFDLAQNLRQRITDMKIKIDRQLRILATLKDQVKDQVVEMQRLEVDVDIKIRSCKGSCASSSGYSVDKESYVVLNKQVNQLDSRSPQESVGAMYVMKSRPLQDALVDSIFKSRDTTAPLTGQQRQDMFPEVNTVSLVIEQEGSSTSPATVSKVPGTSTSSSSSSSTSTSSSSSTGSITELGGNSDLFGTGGGFAAHTLPGTTHVTTSTCTRSVRRTVVMTANGPVEREEEVIHGGPECQNMAGSSSLSSSSSSSSTTVHSSGSSKGLLFGDTKSGFGDPFASSGFDFAKFATDATVDDIPDIHARSAKTVRVERQADYVGKDCVAAYKNHLNGESNGLFTIKPGGAGTTQVAEVYCRQEGLMGGLLLVQQRENGSLSFNRTWAEYRDGFGSVDAKGNGEFWIGNQNLHLLTNQGETFLKVELEDWDGGVAGAEYTIRVGSEEEGYPLHVSGYTGDAGDALVMLKSNPASSLSHNGMKFSTFDKDNDRSGKNCAEEYGGGWWYNSCQAANLNGVYYRGTYTPEKSSVHNGVVWVTYKPADYSLKTVRMFIRSSDF